MTTIKAGTFTVTESDLGLRGEGGEAVSEDLRNGVIATCSADGKPYQLSIDTTTAPQSDYPVGSQIVLVAGTEYPWLLAMEVVSK
jgi:hypothetical protein